MPDTVVDTTSGTVRGRQSPGGSVFLGVPYAAAPLGAARFEPPAPHPGWTGIRDCLEPGPAAPQKPRSGFGALDMSPFFGDIRTGDPDYLRVNIWTPADADRAPVLVFVHGGGFVSGSTRSPLYDGAAFARDGAVVVTVTYRLGIIGFLDLPGAPRNRGLLDVLAALRWVQANIAAFGGDPGNVTLFGQSAGATLVGALLTSPESAGLIRRAIMQSGNGTGAFDPEQAARVTARVGELLGVDAGTSALAGLSDSHLADLGAALTGIDLRTRDRFDPLLGLSAFSVVLETQPADALAAGHGASVPLLIGTNAEEGNLYLAPQSALADSTEQDVVALAARCHPDPAAAVARYRADRPGAGWGTIRAAILGDALFTGGSARLAQAHDTRGQAALHRYRFTWRSPALGGNLGAAHAVELPFVFECTDSAVLHGPAGLLGPQAAPRDLAAEMHGAWVRYAADGAPGWAPSTTYTFTG
ncbi:carboxylesterase [Mycobacterium sp. djl-10]|nr:carboxylesterase [Mycobacterium sp. djl-10]